jgi:hypothetical protein
MLKFSKIVFLKEFFLGFGNENEESFYFEMESLNLIIYLARHVLKLPVLLRLCSDVVFLCCIVSYALRIPRCSVLHHVACLGKDALIRHTLIRPLCTSFLLRCCFFCVASFATPSAFLVAPSSTTSPLLEKTLSFDTLICPLCTSFVLRCCFSVLHRFLRPPPSSLLRLTPRHLPWLGKDALI